uniref:Condensin-2 complex subunit D3 n=1 Tax=Sphenodon punctatus TaxID=8508 RepID=A0A8D0HCF3_SPHPU
GKMGTEGLLPSLESWGLRRVSPAWVDTVWELDFTETEPLDSRIEDEITEDGLNAFSQLYKNLSSFATEDHRTSIWSLFAENNISHNAVVAVLYHFVQEAQSKKANVQKRLYALHAAGLYFLLIEIPGSIANQVFHPVMFDKCLQNLRKSWPQCSDLTRKRKKNQGKSSQADRRNKKRGKPTRKENFEMDEIFEEEEDQEEELFFSTHELLEIREAIFLLLKNLLRLLSKFSLKEKPQCVQNCIQVTRITRNSDRGGEKCILLITLRRVFHRILDVVVMQTGGEGTRNAAITVTSQVVSARNQAINFIRFLGSDYEEGVLAIFLLLVFQVPDKAEYRTYAAQALVQLLHKLPYIEHANFVAWLYRYSRNTKISYRVFALDVALALLNQDERELDSSLSQEHQRLLKHKFLVQIMVFGRCSDKAPTVRSKALSSFAQCLEMKAAAIFESIYELLQSSKYSNRNWAPSSHPLKTLPTFKTIEVTDGGDATVFDGKEIMAMLRLRAGDEKTNVRKSALQVFMSILKHNVISCTEEDLSTLQDRCRDPAVSVRKQALQSVTDLLVSQPNNVLIQKAWLTGVVPVVMDSENSVQEKALECLDQLLLQHIKHNSKFTQDRTQTLAWDLLTLFTTERQELSRYLNKAFHIWSKQDKFSSTFINNVISHTETEHAAPAWMLLAKVAGSSPKLNYSKIIETWDRIRRQQDASTDTTGHVLCVIGHIAKHLPRSTQGRLIDDIKCWLKEFQHPPEVISPAVEAVQKLCHAYADAPGEVQELLNQVCGDLISACEGYISSIVLKEDGAEQLQEDLLVRHLFTLGEAAQLCPAKVEKRIFLLTQSILAGPANMDQLSAPLDGEDLPASQPLSQFRGSVMPSVVRAHAFITLGKLCLQHEDLAKKCIAALARELEVCEDVAIRNNVVIVLCDLCIRYTTMADRYIPNVSACLKDPNPFIRKQTLILLTNLLQEEFVKWKGSLFFRFASALVDPNPDIARFAEFCLVHLLLKRNPVMFSQHFIECLFHFNSYEKHEKYNKFPQSEREKNLFSLKGKENKDKRMQIYKFLLEHFTDEQRFNITSKISLNVLACFVDGVLPLDIEASELLSDTFEILSCKEIKLSAMRSKPDEDVQPDEDEMAMANAVMQVAQKKIISQVQKKNFVENIIPIITSLKALLEHKRLPALRDLMNYLREMMQDYRNEIKDFFAADKQLVAELEYDMKKYEEQVAKERELGEYQDSSVETETPPAPVTGQVQFLASTLSYTLHVSPTSPASPGFTTPKVGNFKPRPRHMSLSTLAILNSAKKAMEASNKTRSRSEGGRLASLSPASSGGSKQVSAYDVISTPMIHNSTSHFPETQAGSLGAFPMLGSGGGFIYLLIYRRFLSHPSCPQGSLGRKKQLPSTLHPPPSPKAWRNSQVLHKRRNDRSVGTNRASSGSKFHSTGATTEKDLTLVATHLTRGTSEKAPMDDLGGRTDTWGVRRSCR